MAFFFFFFSYKYLLTPPVICQKESIRLKVLSHAVNSSIHPTRILGPL